MAELTVNVDDDLMALLEKRAARYGRSVEEEHLEILRQALINEPRHPFWELAAQVRAMTAGRLQTP